MPDIIPESGALKDWFDETFFREFSRALKVDEAAFTLAALDGLEALSLKQRLTHGARLCHKFLSKDYREAVAILESIGPRYRDSFQGMVLPEFVGLYGADDFHFSMEALGRLTVFASAEFAVRGFLERDFEGAMAYMRRWSMDTNPHVRRLASEGARPRLPWGGYMRTLIDNPEPLRPILEQLKSDRDPMVRRSVANNLNDIAKDNPDWMLDLVEGWDRSSPEIVRVIRHGTRSLLKSRHPRAFSLFGFTKAPEVSVENFVLSHDRLSMGETLTFSFTLASHGGRTAKLAVDYILGYVKKSGKRAPKVFKLTEATLEPKERQNISKSQTFKKFSTRTHYSGTHSIAVTVNGEVMAEGSFVLVV